MRTVDHHHDQTFRGVARARIGGGGQPGNDRKKSDDQNDTLVIKSEYQEVARRKCRHTAGEQDPMRLLTRRTIRLVSRLTLPAIFQMLGQHLLRVP
ncbi:hypothetical protein [Azospirillum argentinense]|uniref:hypothetical protein n=1 Tax=Azospirillum argentinense TaxID=2970906 RepID=UPI0015867D53|nr:hypothetical protein [Azospirillum argentinense]